MFSIQQRESKKPPSIFGLKEKATEIYGVFNRFTIASRRSADSSAPSKFGSKMATPLHPNNREHEFIQQIRAIFPDLSHGAVRMLGRDFDYDIGQAINSVMNEDERHQLYSTRHGMKRKRDPGAGVEPEGKGKKPAEPPPPRFVPKSAVELHSLCRILRQEFPCVPDNEILRLFREQNHCLRTTYLTLDRYIRSWDSLRDKPWKMLNDREVPKTYAQPRHQQNLTNVINSCTAPFKKSVLEELAKCWKLRVERDKELNGQTLGLGNEVQVNLDEQQGGNDPNDGDQDMIECQCCFTESPLPRMVHCEGATIHFFCSECARRNAETVIGLNKYELTCMSMDKCDGSFSHSERSKFLDERLVRALDRIESAAVLLMANLDNLVTCPFCNFAAEYPPIEEDGDFRCGNPECGIVSCRRCSTKSHWPKNCTDAKKETGQSARREIEEAMSAALIRKCNKCQTPFVKEIGCNKMTCPQAGCGNMQCYICSKSCDYKHFKDNKSKEDKYGNCPLYDDVETRHQKEVHSAEKSARAAVIEKRPDIDPNLLNFDMSDNVTRDDERRKERATRARNNPLGAFNLGMGAPALDMEQLRARAPRRRNDRPHIGRGAGIPVGPGIVPDINPQLNRRGVRTKTPMLNQMLQHNSLKRKAQYPGTLRTVREDQYEEDPVVIGARYRMQAARDAQAGWQMLNGATPQLGRIGGRDPAPAPQGAPLNQNPGTHLAPGMLDNIFGHRKFFLGQPQGESERFLAYTNQPETARALDFGGVHGNTRFQLANMWPRRENYRNVGAPGNGTRFQGHGNIPQGFIGNAPWPFGPRPVSPAVEQTVASPTMANAGNAAWTGEEPEEIPTTPPAWTGGEPEEIPTTPPAWPLDYEQPWKYEAGGRRG